jgi:hypothetical protein
VATSVQVTFDCVDPARMATFWAAALGYEVPGPPGDFATWPEFLTATGVPESMWNDFSAVEDPDGSGPRIFFQRVPEPKAIKNRLHLDVNLGGGRGVPEEESRGRLAGEVERLVGLGATKVEEMELRGEFWIVMRDVEDNEFCVQ